VSTGHHPLSGEEQEERSHGELVASCRGNRDSGGVKAPLDTPEARDVPGGRCDADDLSARLEALPANHPSSLRYRNAETHRREPSDSGCPSLPDRRDGAAFGDRAAASDLPPLTDEEYADHIYMVEARLGEAERRGMSSQRLYAVDPEGKVWIKSRADQQVGILDDIRGAKADVPCDGKAVIAGGLGGAGKTTVLSRFAGIDRAKYLTVNPDDIKEKMAERGMIPEVDGLAPMECSQLVHEESSLLAGSLANRACADRRNVIWDITMSRYDSAAKRIDDLRDGGYTDILGVFVDIPAAKSVERAQSRHYAGMEEYRNGRGYGGRHLSPDLILGQQAADGQTINRKVFEALKPKFDRWLVFDNSVDGRDPVLIESSDDPKERS
jgi:predicted ABC-type ATPase